MKVTLLLADSAQAVEGKLYILGGGWSIIGPEPTPMAIAVKIEVPWDQTNRRHTWQFVLLDSDGRPVTAEEQADRDRRRVRGRASRRDQAGNTHRLAARHQHRPAALTPDSRYVWCLSIDGDSDDHWRLAFSTRPAGQPDRTRP